MRAPFTIWGCCIVVSSRLFLFVIANPAATRQNPGKSRYKSAENVESKSKIV